MTVFCEDGKFKAAITDKDSGMVAFLSSDSFQGLLEALDRGLGNGSLDWRQSNFRKK